MDKFTSQVQIEETADFQEWLDAQEVADIRAIEAEEAGLLGETVVPIVRACGNGKRFSTRV